MVMIKITNTTRKREFPRLMDALEGKTYMNLKVVFCPAGGSFDVCVETQYDTTEEDLREMVLGLLADNLMGGV